MFAMCVVWQVIIVAPSELEINEIQVTAPEGDSVSSLKKMLLD